MIIPQSFIFTASVIFILLVLSIFWLMYFFDINGSIDKESRNEIENKWHPKVAILIPTIFEGRRLLDTIKNVREVDYSNYKIYIVLNKSSTKETIESAEESGEFIIRAPMDGKAAVMNYALKNFIKEEFVLILDADTFIAPDLIKRLIYHFRDKDVAAVVSSVKVYKPKNIVEFFQYYEYLFSILSRKALSRINGLVIVHGAGSMFRTDILRKVGYFDEKNLTEDMEIGMRLLVSGYKVESSIKAVSYTVVPNSLSKLFRQRIRWFSGYLSNIIRYIKYAKKSKNSTIWRITIPFTLISIALSFLIVIGLVYTIVTIAIPDYGILVNTSPSFFLSTMIAPISFLTLNSQIILEIIGLAIGLFSLFYSLRTIDHHFAVFKDFIGVILYIFIYSTFLSFVWLYSAFMIPKFNAGKLVWIPNI